MRDDLEPFHSVVIGVGSYGRDAINVLRAFDLTPGNMWAKDLKCFAVDAKGFTSNDTEAVSPAAIAAIGQAYLVFIVSDMTREAEVCLARIAECVRPQEALTVGIVPNPIGIEAEPSSSLTDSSLEKLLSHVNSLILVPRTPPAPTAKDVCAIITGLLDIVTRSGLIGLDFADVKIVLGNGGLTHFGYGAATGKDRAAKAAMEAINGPALTKDKLVEAQGVILSITGDDNISLDEVTEVTDAIIDCCKEDASVFFQGYYDGKDGELSVFMLACAEGTKDARQAFAQRSFVDWEEEVFPIDYDELESPAFIRPSSFGELVPGPVPPLPAEQNDGKGNNE